MSFGSFAAEDWNEAKALERWRREQEMTERDRSILELVKSLQTDFELFDFATEIGPRAARKALRRYTKAHHKTLIAMAALLAEEESNDRKV